MSRKLPKKLDSRQPTLFAVPKSAPIQIPQPIKKIEDPDVINWLAKLFDFVVSQWEENTSTKWRQESFPEYIEYMRTFRRNGFIEEANSVETMIMPYGPK